MLEGCWKVNLLTWKVWISLQFTSSYVIFILHSKCQGWSAAPISACLRRGPGDCFRSECCIDDVSMTALRVNRALHPHWCRTRGWTSRKYRFPSFRRDPTCELTQPNRFRISHSTKRTASANTNFCFSFYHSKNTNASHTIFSGAILSQTFFSCIWFKHNQQKLRSSLRTCWLIRDKQ